MTDKIAKLEAVAKSMLEPVEMPKLRSLVLKREIIEDFTRDFQSLATILRAYDNILAGKRGRDGLWTFEGEQVNNFRVTIRKPSPRDLPDVSIIDSESRNPISLSQLVIRTRDKLDLIFDGGIGPDNININSELSKAFAPKLKALIAARDTIREGIQQVETMAKENELAREEIKKEKIRIERRDGECHRAMLQAKAVATLGYWILAGALTQVFTVIVSVSL